MSEKIHLIELLAREGYRCTIEDGTISEENSEYLEHLQRAVDHFFYNYGHFDWTMATVEILEPEQDGDIITRSYILTSVKQEQKYMSFKYKRQPEQRLIFASI